MFSFQKSLTLKVITEDAFLDVFPQMRDPGVLGIVIGIFEIGCLMGALSCMELGDRLGRRKTVCVGMFMLVVGISLP
jgi:MFS family permease